MAHIHIDNNELTQSCSESDLRSEINHRIATGNGSSEPIDTDTIPWTRQGLSADLRLAFYRRDASEFEALLRVLDTKEDFR